MAAGKKADFHNEEEKHRTIFFVTLEVIPLFSSFFAVPARVIWAAPHRDVELPCDLTPPSLHDGVKLVLWFKDSEGIPMYSLDSRNGGSLKAATHSALAGIRGERVFFSVAENPKDAKLRIKSVEEADGGIYRCRVDYFNSPTRNFRVNLTLVGKCCCFVVSIQSKIQISFSINFPIL
jgi:Immunoglobulin V-set domain